MMLDAMAEAAAARLLLVDDDIAYADVTVRRLERAGFEVLRATSWVDAAKELRLGPRLVLLDVHLPGLQGNQVCKAIKGTYPETRVLLISSEDELSLRKLSLESDADGYVTKDAGFDALLYSVRKHVAHRP